MRDSPVARGGTVVRRPESATPETVRVWLVRTDPPALPSASLAALLDSDERARAERLDQATRSRFVAAHGAARLIIGHYLGTAPERLRWTHGRYGKPALVDANGLQVSLSHSGGLTAVAVSQSRPVGVDLQQQLPRMDVVAMSERYFPPADVRFVTQAGSPAERSDRFTLLWARKEACAKAAGGRLVDGLRLPVVHQPGDPSGPDGTGLVVTVSGEGSTGRVRVRDLAAPTGFRSAVALHGDQAFEATVSWWPQEYSDHAG